MLRLFLPRRIVVIATRDVKQGEVVGLGVFATCLRASSRPNTYLDHQKRLLALKDVGMGEELTLGSFKHGASNSKPADKRRATFKTCLNCTCDRRR